MASIKKNSFWNRWRIFLALDAVGSFFSRTLDKFNENLYCCCCCCCFFHLFKLLVFIISFVFFCLHQHFFVHLTFLVGGFFLTLCQLNCSHTSCFMLTRSHQKMLYWIPISPCNWFKKQTVWIPYRTFEWHILHDFFWIITKSDGFFLPKYLKQTFAGKKKQLESRNHPPRMYRIKMSSLSFFKLLFTSLEWHMCSFHADIEISRLKYLLNFSLPGCELVLGVCKMLNYIRTIKSSFCISKLNSIVCK